MFTLFKANISSLIATVSDYLITTTAVQLFSTHPVIGGIIGTTCGGAINFLIGRRWVFVSKSANDYMQGFRYFLVWCGHLVLNTTGMYLFMKLGANYIVAKVVTSLMVALVYNYPLQKRYVFKAIDQ